MQDDPSQPPEALKFIFQRTAELGFGMACENRTGAFLRVLAAMKPGGRLVELGTGTGAATAWLLDGMTIDAKLITIDNDPAPLSIAREALGSDPRLEIIQDDAGAWLTSAQPRSADLVFADAWPGKYEALDASLALLKPGGIWIGDDLLPQENWPEGHEQKAENLLSTLSALQDYVSVSLSWASGLVLVSPRV